MFIPKAQVPEFEKLPFGVVMKHTKFPGQQLIVTRLGLVTVDELKPHPYGNFYNHQPTPGKSPFNRPGNWT